MVRAADEDGIAGATAGVEEGEDLPPGVRAGRRDLREPAVAGGAARSTRGGHAEEKGPGTRHDREGERHRERARQQGASSAPPDGRRALREGAAQDERGRDREEGVPHVRAPEELREDGDRERRHQEEVEPGTPAGPAPGEERRGSEERPGERERHGPFERPDRERGNVRPERRNGAQQVRNGEEPRRHDVPDLIEIEVRRGACDA